MQKLSFPPYADIRRARIYDAASLISPNINSVANSTISHINMMNVASLSLQTELKSGTEKLVRLRVEQFSVRTIEVTCRTTGESCKPQQWKRDTHAPHTSANEQQNNSYKYALKIYSMVLVGAHTATPIHSPQWRSAISFCTAK